MAGGVAVDCCIKDGLRCRSNSSSCRKVVEYGKGLLGAGVEVLAGKALVEAGVAKLTVGT